MQDAHNTCARLLAGYNLMQGLMAHKPPIFDQIIMAHKVLPEDFVQGFAQDLLWGC